LIKRFLAFYQPHRALFFWDMGAVFLMACADLVYPNIVRQIINDYVPSGNTRLFALWGVALFFIYLAKAGLNYFTEYYGHLVGIGMQADMRNTLFSHLQKLPLAYYDEHMAGDLMSRLVNDLNEMAELAHHGPENLLLGSITLIGAFFILGRVSLKLTVVLFLALPLVIIFALAMQNRMDEVSTRTREELSEVNSDLENALAGIRVTRAYVNSTYESMKFAGQIERFRAASARRYKIMAELSSGIFFFTDVFYLIVMTVGGFFFFRGEINVGDFTMFLLYAGTFQKPILQFWSFFERLQGGMTGFRRVLEIMDMPAEEEHPEAVAVASVVGEIEFRDVSFSYTERRGANTGEEEGDAREATPQHEVISHLNLHIPPGKTIALVGPSGGGKTTLCHLIPRFYDITSGAILIDGRDLRHFTRDSLRQHIGIVAQEVFLFAGSIRENIAYGDLRADEEAIRQAAQRARIHDFILSLEYGYDTFIGERGVKLSGGQKQRLSIARAFLKDPSILILDEATSSLDNATEALIQEALDELAVGRTTIAVAHRLSTIYNADEIIVLTTEGIVERGDHRQLLALGGVYAELHGARSPERVAWDVAEH